MQSDPQPQPELQSPPSPPISQQTQQPPSQPISQPEPETEPEPQAVNSQSEQQFIEEEIKQPASEIEPVVEQIPEILQHTLEENVCIDNYNVVLVGYFGKKVEISGKFKVTNIRIIYYFVQKNNKEEILFDIPIGLLQKVQKFNDDKFNPSVQIHLRYGSSFKIRYPESQLSIKTQRLLVHLIETSLHLAYQYGTKVSLPLKCQLFCPSNCEEVKEAHWYDNQGWKYFINYPQKFRVPLPYLSKTNKDERLVFLSFVYHNGKDEVSLWRTGPGRPDPSEEQWMSKTKNNSKTLTIQIKNRGIGSTRSLATRVVQLQNLSQLKQSFVNFYKLAVNNHDSLKWISQNISTKWYEQISTLLQEASIVANQIINRSAHITVLADTEVRGAQLVSLCQVLLFPECRTVRGFGELIQRQFLQWGASRSSVMGKKESEPDRGPALIQFLDAVYQLTNIYPLSFEFRQTFLVFLAEQIYSNHFGNFLLLSKTLKEEQRGSILKCACIWKTFESWLQNPQLHSYYMNPFHIDHKQCDIYELKQRPSMKQMKIWSGFFFKKFREHNPDYKQFHRYNQLFREQHQNKRQVQELKKQLLQLHKTIQQRKNYLQVRKEVEKV